MSEAKILIVDDEPNVQFVLKSALKHDGYSLDTASNGSEAIEKIRKENFDLILLDLYMRPVDGMQVLNAVRANDPETVVIILTGHSTVESAVEALRLGAFDYLFKPASPDTIRERVREGLKRRQQTTQRARLLKQMDSLRETLMELEAEAGEMKGSFSPNRFRIAGSLILDLHHRTATLGDRLLDLTTTEFNVLSHLVQQSPQAVSPRQLLNSALEYDTAEKEAGEIIKWHIHHLRQKVEPDPLKPRYIKTVRYKGYLWSGE